MSLVTAVVFSILLLTVTGCVTAGGPSAAKQGMGKKVTTVKPAKHDEKKAMNEESENAIR
jgi:Flp pilus assembly protein TadD